VRATVSIICAVVLGLDGLYIAEALKYPLGTLSRPGAGFYPLLVGILIGVAALATAAQAQRGGVDPEVAWPDRSGVLRVLAVIAAALSYIVLLPCTGQLLAAVPATAVPLRVMGTRRWWQLAGLTALFASGSYYLFAVILRVPFPAGIFGG
jgi:hypothetical protein